MFKLLVVDDDPNITDGITAIIQNHFPETFETTAAYDGYQALTYMTESYYHLVISDIRMPQLDGIHLLEIIHNDRLPTTVIMLSGFDDYMYIRSTLRLGAYDYLLKPVNIHNFVEIVSNLIPELKHSTKTLSVGNLCSLTDIQKSDHYFNLPPLDGIALTPQQIAMHLERLQQHVLELNAPEVSNQVYYLFHHLSEELISKEDLKKLFSSFIYSLMQKNNSLIKIIAQYKLSEYDLSAQIKSQPHLSQLEEKFIQILCLYISQLETLQKNHDEYLVKKAQAYIDRHFSEQLMLADIAAQFRLHPNYFSFLFKKHLNVTVRDYILHLRIDRAKEMMYDPSLRLLDIALAVGYQDAAHFNRAFKNVVGVSPSQYRSEIELKQ